LSPRLGVEEEYGQSALTAEAMMGHTEVGTLLLDQGADIEKADREGRTPLMWAAQYGRVETVELLLSRGAKADTKDKKGRTAMWWTRMIKRTDIRKRIREILRNAEPVVEERRS